MLIKMIIIKAKFRIQTGNSRFNWTSIKYRKPVPWKLTTLRMMMSTMTMRLRQYGIIFQMKMFTNKIANSQQILDKMQLIMLTLTIIFFNTLFFIPNTLSHSRTSTLNPKGKTAKIPKCYLQIIILIKLKCQAFHQFQVKMKGKIAVSLVCLLKSCICKTK